MNYSAVYMLSAQKPHNQPYAVILNHVSIRQNNLDIVC